MLTKSLASLALRGLALASKFLLVVFLARYYTPEDLGVFGLPLVEAMACGTPVLTANTSCLPEIVGDAGVVVEPLDIEQIACQMDALINDASLRSTMFARGLERV